jgi:excinuclease ABC subunit C
MIDKLPTNPGCYLFKNDKNKIIYVGKAKNIKKRVSSYFSKKDLDPKTENLVKNISSVDFIVTNNEAEAFILENTLIKKHKPKYNIDLKDSKRYPFIMVTKEEFPRLVTVRTNKDEGHYFGPFISGMERKDLITLINKTFKIRTCSKLPKKVCLRYHIDLCKGPCQSFISKEDYDKDVKKAMMVLKGKNNELLKSIKTELKDVSKKQEFEKAIELRNQMYAIQYLMDKQQMERIRKYDEDIINYIKSDGKIYLMIFNIYKGTLNNKKEFVFDYIDGFLESFLIQFYSESKLPKEIILPDKVDLSIKDFFEHIKKNKIHINVPKIGEKKNLLELVKKNIELSFFGDIGKLKELKDKLKLNDIPYVIECFDISHLSGSSTVGSMVQFRNAKPDKSNYRRFKIKTYEGIDDYLGISEVVRRRYSRLKDENSEFPNLIIIDGGRGQLNAALSELNKLNIRIPIISIAKKFEEIYVPGLSIPIRLSKMKTALKFVQEIRDEAHRFAIKYNRLLRKKDLIK